MLKSFLKLFAGIAGGLLVIYAMILLLGTVILELTKSIPPIPAWMAVAIALVVIAAVVSGIVTAIERITD